MKYTFLFHNNTCKSTERGVTIYLAILVLAAVLGIVFGIGSLFVGQIQLARGTGDAVIAFYAAEAGIERESFEGNAPPSMQNGTLSNGASYSISVLDVSDPSCNGNILCIKSIGTFQEAQRAIFLDF